MLYTRTCGSTDADDRFSGDADANEIFEELVEGMVGVTYDEDRLGCVVVDRFREKGTDERLSST